MKTFSNSVIGMILLTRRVNDDEKGNINKNILIKINDHECKELILFSAKVFTSALKKISIEIAFIKHAF